MTRENTENTATDLRTRLRAGRSAMTKTSRSRGALLMRARLFAWLGMNRSLWLFAITGVIGNLSYWALASNN